MRTSATREFYCIFMKHAYLLSDPARAILLCGSALAVKEEVSWLSSLQVLVMLLIFVVTAPSKVLIVSACYALTQAAGEIVFRPSIT